MINIISISFILTCWISSILAFNPIKIKPPCHEVAVAKHFLSIHVKSSVNIAHITIAFLLIASPFLPGSIDFALAKENSEAKIFLSGKNPIATQGGDPKAGTKKDIKFLRCLSNCKSKCQLPSEGLAEERVDCVQDCQDICCETYEQCSFRIKTM